MVQSHTVRNGENNEEFLRGSSFKLRVSPSGSSSSQSQRRKIESKEKSALQQQHSSHTAANVSSMRPTEHEFNPKVMEIPQDIFSRLQRCQFNFAELYSSRKEGKSCSVKSQKSLSSVDCGAILKQCLFRRNSKKKKSRQKRQRKFSFKRFPSKKSFSSILPGNSSKEAAHHVSENERESLITSSDDPSGGVTAGICSSPLAAKSPSHKFSFDFKLRRSFSFKRRGTSSSEKNQDNGTSLSNETLNSGAAQNNDDKENHAPAASASTEENPSSCQNGPQCSPSKKKSLKRLIRNGSRRMLSLTKLREI